MRVSLNLIPLELDVGRWSWLDTWLKDYRPIRPFALVLRPLCAHQLIQYLKLLHCAVRLVPGARPFVSIYIFRHASPSPLLALLGANLWVHQSTHSFDTVMIFFSSPSSLFSFIICAYIRVRLLATSLDRAIFVSCLFLPTMVP